MDKWRILGDDIPNSRNGSYIPSNMNKKQLKNKELQIREEKVKLARERFELRKKIYDDLRGKTIEPHVVEIIKMLMK